MALWLVAKKSCVRAVLWTDDSGLADRIAKPPDEAKKVFKVGLTCEVVWPEVEFDVCIVEEVAGKSDATDGKCEEASELARATKRRWQRQRLLVATILNVCRRRANGLKSLLLIGSNRPENVEVTKNATAGEVLR